MFWSLDRGHKVDSNTKVSVTRPRRRGQANANGHKANILAKTPAKAKSLVSTLLEAKHWPYGQDWGQTLCHGWGCGHCNEAKAKAEA